KPVFTYNLLDTERFRWEGGLGLARDVLGKALPPGKHTLVFDFKYDGPGPGKGGTGVFTVDGKEMAKKTIAHTIPLLMSIDETFDIGLDTGTGVDESYKLPFKFTGSIDKLTIKLGPSQMSAEEQKASADAVAQATDYPPRPLVSFLSKRHEPFAQTHRYHRSSHGTRVDRRARHRRPVAARCRNFRCQHTPRPRRGSRVARARCRLLAGAR